MTDDLVERVAKAMRDVYLARQPKYSGAEGYPLEEFLPEADAAIAVCMEEAAKVAGKWQQMHFEDGKVHSSNITEYIVADIRALVKNG